MKLATENRADPRLNADYRLVKAVFYYGGPHEYPVFLQDRWAAVTPAYVEDCISDLCRELAKLSGNTLAPATFYERAKMSFAELPPIDDADWASLSEGTRQNLLALKDRFTVHGSGFLISWSKVAA